MNSRRPKLIQFLTERRCNDNAEFLHNVERVQIHAASRLQPDRHERLGRGLHVLYLRQSTRIRLRKLRGQEATFTQCRLQAGRKPGDSGMSIYPRCDYF